jgi:hypothetical protein
MARGDHPRLRRPRWSRILSIGLPVCSLDNKLAYGPTVALMRAYPNTSLGEILANPQRQAYFLEHGAVVLSPLNMDRWKGRIASAIRYHFLSRDGAVGTSGSGTDHATCSRGTGTRRPAGGAGRLKHRRTDRLDFVLEERGSRRTISARMNSPPRTAPEPCSALTKDNEDLREPSGGMQ